MSFASLRMTSSSDFPLSSLRLQRRDIAKQHSLVTFGAHFFVHLADHALGIDHETGALPELHPFRFRLADAERLHQAGIGIGKQIDGKGELVGEILVRGHVVGAYADDLDPGGVESRLGRRKRLALDGAARRVVFRIKIDDQPVSGEVGKVDGFAVLIGKRKIREGIACGKHKSLLCLWLCIVGGQRRTRLPSPLSWPSSKIGFPCVPLCSLWLRIQKLEPQGTQRYTEESSILGQLRANSEDRRSSGFHHFPGTFLQLLRRHVFLRSEENTSELQSRQDLHAFPTRRSSDLLYLRPTKS